MISDESGCVIRCEVRRLECAAWGVRTEQVPWARAGSRFTRAFEDTCVHLAKHAPKSTVAALMRPLVDSSRAGPRCRPAG